MRRSMNTSDVPPVTVVISTRNRGGNIVKTIQAILLNDYSAFELRVVDQSENDLTATALQPFLANPRMRYIRTATKGLSAGLNLGISDAESEFLAITGDDCEVQKNWLRELVAGFAVDHRIAIVFGNVLPGPHDGSMGFVPAYVRDEPFLARSIREKHRIGGTSACMGLRRTIWRELGGFDEMLGVGAPLKAAEDTDLTLRAFLGGYFVYERPSVAVIHHGFYRWEQHQALIYGYWYGTGAALAKALKRRPWSVAQLLICLAWQWAVGRSRVAAGFDAHPHRMLRLVAFVQGFGVGAVTPVEKTTGHYVRQKAARVSSPIPR